MIVELLGVIGMVLLYGAGGLLVLVFGLATLREFFSPAVSRGHRR